MKGGKTKLFLAFRSVFPNMVTYTYFGMQSPQCSLPLPGTCVSFSHEDKDLFLIGSENGGLYKCSLRSSREGVLKEEDLWSPIKFVFRPHHGPVYDISTSPFHRNLFVSCGTDATVRVYSLLDVSGVQWYMLFRGLR